MNFNEHTAMLYFAFLVLVNYVHSANILGVFQFPSLSHQVVFQPLWKELSLRGHNVTVVTPYPLKDTSLVNLTEIDVSYVKYLNSVVKIMSKDSPTTEIMEAFYKLSEKIQEEILKNEQFIKLYNNSDVRFDVILVESLHPGMFSLSGKFKAPIIGILSLGASVAVYDSIGNANHPVLFSDKNLPFDYPMTLKDKFYSIYFYLWMLYHYNYNVIPSADKVAKKYLGNDIGYLGDLSRNISMLFVNTNPIVYTPKPNIPIVVELGQMHIKPMKPLPKDLQEILDNATEGVVYFSLGSNVKSINLREELKNTIIDALSELPYKVLWKWDESIINERQKNIVTRKWFPQQDILAHPNVKVFFTQGGLQSIEEAISRGVPMVAMPFLGDQPKNVLRIAKAGIAIGIDSNTVTKEELKSVIREVAENSDFKRNILRAREILNDQPMTGLQRAVWWTEYVIRHKGTSHFKSPTADISWVEYLLLDIIVFVVGVLLVVVYILNKIIKFLVSWFRYGKVKVS